MGHRNAQQSRAGRARHQRGIGGTCLGQCRFFIEIEESAEFGIGARTRQKMPRRLHSRDFALTQLRGQFGHAEIVQLSGRFHSITLGTRNRPCSTLGALR